MLLLGPHFGTEAKCYRALYRWRWPNGFRCPACNGRTRSRFQRGQAIYYQCCACRHQTTLTSGTLLESTKLPLTKWFQAIYLLSSTKTNLAALELTNTCVVAWRGTEVTNLWDVLADLRGQAAFANELIPNKRNVEMRGGRGFVNRVTAHSETITNLLSNLRCTSIFITGHSLGGAAASIFGLQLAHDNRFNAALDVVAVFNSPNVVNAATLGGPLRTMKLTADVLVNCRNHDWLVNPLPSGLHRIADEASSPVGRCTYVLPGTWSALRRRPWSFGK